MAKKPYSYLFAAALCAGSLAGCGTPTPAYDAQFGSAVKQAILMQTLDPEAAYKRQTVNGIDAQAGAALVGRYREGFARPEPPPAPSIAP
jgi:hypothetical protein